MGKWFEQFQPIIWFAGLALASLAFIYQSFATIKYVDTKHEGVMDVLKEIREDVRELRKISRKE